MPEQKNKCISFRVYRGLPWAEVPLAYLEWIVKNTDSQHNRLLAQGEMENRTIWAQEKLDEERATGVRTDRRYPQTKESTERAAV